MAAGGLKLRAVDAEDLRVLAAVLQDALVPLGDIAYQKRQKRVVLVANRFLWEDQTELEAIDDAEISDRPPPLEGDAAS